MAKGDGIAGAATAASNVRLGKLALIGLAAVAGSALAGPRSETLRPGGEPVTVTAEPLPGFDRADPQRTRFGQLEWRGGLVLTSATPAFGGWSGLALGKDGRKLVAVSDMGTWMTAELAGAGGRPAALRSVRMGPLPGSSGKPLSRRRDIDAESLVLASGSVSRGTVFVSFERNHRIAEMALGPKGLTAPRRFLPLPPGAARAMAPNEGLEAIAVLADGGLAAIAERPLSGGSVYTGWLWTKGKPEKFYLTNPGDFSVTDAKGLEGGGLVVLERRFHPLEGVQMRLRHVPAADLRAGATIAGETLIEAGMSKEIDNMEALAIHTGPKGERILTLLSDDNFQKAVQRTILLQFSWAPSKLAGTRPRQ